MLLKNDFICSVARIRALESRLLTTAQVERMVSAPNAKEAFKVLNDLDWANFLGEADKPEDFNAVIDAGLLEVQQLINSAVDIEGNFNFLWLLFDVYNAKVLIKALLKGEDADDVKSLLSPLGIVSRGKMRRIVFEGEHFEHFEELSELIEECKSVYEKTKNPEKVELIIEKAGLGVVLSMTQKTSPMIKKFFKRYVDVKNILSFLRRVDFDNNESNLEFFIEGGELDKSIFENSTSLGDFIDKINSLSIKETLKSKISDEKINSYLELEKALDENLFSILKPSKWESEGPDPIFAYFWQKKRNAEIIRAILVGKLNNVPEKQIRSWLKTPSITL